MASLECPTCDTPRHASVVDSSLSSSASALKLVLRSCWVCYAQNPQNPENTKNTKKIQIPRPLVGPRKYERKNEKIQSMAVLGHSCSIFRGQPGVGFCVFFSLRIFRILGFWALEEACLVTIQDVVASMTQDHSISTRDLKHSSTDVCPATPVTSASIGVGAFAAPLFWPGAAYLKPPTTGVLYAPLFLYAPLK